MAVDSPIAGARGAAFPTMSAQGAAFPVMTTPVAEYVFGQGLADAIATMNAQIANSLAGLVLAMRDQQEGIERQMEPLMAALLSIQSEHQARTARLAEHLMTIALPAMRGEVSVNARQADGLTDSTVLGPAGAVIQATRGQDGEGVGRPLPYISERQLVLTLPFVAVVLVLHMALTFGDANEQYNPTGELVRALENLFISYMACCFYQARVARVSLRHQG